MANHKEQQEDSEFTSPLQIDAWLGFLQVHSLLARKVEQQLLKEHHITLTIFRILYVLSKGNTIRLTELAHMVSLSPSQLSRLIDQLFSEGYLERQTSKEDARAALVTLTEKGQQFWQEAQNTHASAVHHYFLNHFSAQELQQLENFWQRILKSLV